MTTEQRTGATPITLPPVSPGMLLVVAALGALSGIATYLVMGLATHVVPQIEGYAQERVATWSSRLPPQSKA